MFDFTFKLNKTIAYGLFLLIIYVFSARYGYMLEIGGVQPVVIVSVVALIGMFEGPVAGAGAGFFAGFLTDAMTSYYTGFHLITYMLAGFACGWICVVYFRKKLVTALIWGLLANLFVGLLRFLLYFIMFSRAPLSALWTVVLPEAAYTLPFTLVLYLPARFIYIKTSEYTEFSR